MTNPIEPLWPYGKRSALLAIPLIWGLTGALLLLTHQFLGWPNFNAAKIVVPIAALLGFLPLSLVLIDFAVSNRTILNIKGVKIDFSQQTGALPSFGLPDNIGIAGAEVSDSSPMKIIDALEQATQSQVAVIDIKDGNAWWVTRLLALCAGAVRSGHPKAIVFIGMREGLNGSFLGWSEPQFLLTAMLKEKEELHSTYRRAEGIAVQLVSALGTELLPNPAPPLHADVARYAHDPDYVKLGPAVFEQVLMDQLALHHESPADRLTLGRLHHLFEHCLRRDSVNLSEAGDQQIVSLLRAKADYIALMKQDRYLGLLEAKEGQRLVMQQLFSKANQNLIEDI